MTCIFNRQETSNMKLLMNLNELINQYNTFLLKENPKAVIKNSIQDILRMSQFQSNYNLLEATSQIQLFVLQNQIIK